MFDLNSILKHWHQTCLSLVFRRSLCLGINSTHLLKPDLLLDGLGFYDPCTMLIILVVFFFFICSLVVIQVVLKLLRKKQRAKRNQPCLSTLSFRGKLDKTWGICLWLLAFAWSKKGLNGCSAWQWLSGSFTPSGYITCSLYWHCERGGTNSWYNVCTGHQ